ncbi:hypothetical protein CEV34_5610 [Brucella pseudogrignonensis]|uniref:Uncharacterized protein n=1 Tax=Brucella pseudogrignonensis TaxID=419475 RepID=A0A256G050_9HYPH|nr:hypothetical protein CEV34_5610 [Brucella pseudogrignonensis]
MQLLRGCSIRLAVCRVPLASPREFGLVSLVGLTQGMGFH